MNELEPTIAAMEVPTLEKQILIVEDEIVFAKAVKKQLQRAGYKCEIAGDLDTAREKFESQMPDLVLLDMRLPDGSGLDFLESIKNGQNPNAAVLVMSAYGELEDAVSAMKMGASDYLKKPVDLEELLINIEKVLDKNELETKLTYSSKRERNASETVDLIGECPGIISVKQQIEQIARLTRASKTVPPTVFILGETGTGKDVVARLLHASTALSDKPFVQIDCASLPKDLIEAELFGHEKGAFTNAHAARTGLIEAAEDGVLFMDEIGELPPDLQSKLLAVLDRRLMRRVGTTKELPVRAWFIAATNRNIEDLVSKGEFRTDLYYRLNVLSIEMPSLRTRGNDIIILAKYFSEQTVRRYGFEKVSLSDEAVQALMEYSWPGNVRELKHLIERAVLLNSGGELSSDALGLTNRALSGHTENSQASDSNIEDMTLESAELTLITQALDKANGNVSKAARELDITRMAMRYRMKKYNL
ncbi:MAG: sigma-54 dependent transcriptional regulator [Proteobacteria bacterium]|nr:sigma-54 dependent transcriptional regulator [Pseudomonadota bacterium]